MDPQHPMQHGTRERFEEHVVEAGGELVAVQDRGTDDWARHRAGVAAEACQHLTSRHVGKEKVEQDQIRVELGGQAHTLRAGPGPPRINAERLDLAAEQRPQVVVVLDDEDQPPLAGAGAHHRHRNEALEAEGWLVHER